MSGEQSHEMQPGTVPRRSEGPSLGPRSCSLSRTWVSRALSLRTEHTLEEHLGHCTSCLQASTFASGGRRGDLHVSDEAPEWKVR